MVDLTAEIRRQFAAAHAKWGDTFELQMLRNSWGDTPYSIAKAKRYCGPDHPVTQMLRKMCYSGATPLGDRCLASYEIGRRRG